MNNTIIIESLGIKEDVISITRNTLSNNGFSNNCYSISFNISIESNYLNLSNLLDGYYNNYISKVDKIFIYYNNNIILLLYNTIITNIVYSEYVIDFTLNPEHFQTVDEKEIKYFLRKDKIINILNRIKDGIK